MRDKAYFQDQHLRLKYGITLAEFNRLLARQRGVCWICRLHPRFRRLDVDHCHQCGVIRGILCTACNVRLERQFATAKLQRRAERYLARHRCSPELTQVHRS